MTTSSLPQSALEAIDKVVDEYTGSPDADAYGRALRELDELGVEHGDEQVLRYLEGRRDSAELEWERLTVELETMRAARTGVPTLNFETPLEPSQIVKPLWEGTVGFDRAWQETIGYLMEGEPTLTETGVEITLDAGYVQAQAVLFELAAARVIRFEPEQVEVLPSWEAPEHLWDFAADVSLPFPHLFLDFEAFDRCPRFSLERLVPDCFLRLQSACVYRRPEDDLLVVLPRVSIEITGEVNAPGTIATVVFVPPQPGREGERWEQRVASKQRLNGRKLVGTFTAVRLEGYHGAVALLPRTRGMYEESAISLDLPEKGPTLETFAAGTALYAAGRAMAALSILDSEMVELEDAPVPRPSRRRMQREGGRIAHIVTIRSPRRGPKNKPSGEEARYSHRFWVRGHTKHFPLDTMMATARPDLVKPCTRQVGACPKGVCRRIWTPPFLKGPPDRPVILKTLVRK